MQAEVHQFFKTRGFGFLLEGFKNRVFFHVNDWQSSIEPQPGMRVTFDFKPSKRPGFPPQATNIMPLENDNKAGA